MKNIILKKYFGFESLRKEQDLIISSVLAGNNTIGILPTGFGKSITFQLPALMLDGITVVITPLIALMHDQVMNLKRKGIGAEFINSSLLINEIDLVYKKLNDGAIKILYISAERLGNKRFIHEIKKINISLIVCDEAHTLMWSEDFRPALGNIYLFVESLNYRPTILALTATANNKTVNKICRYLNINNPKIFIGNCDRKNIFYRVVKTSKKLEFLHKYILHNLDKLGIIYCVTIKNVYKVYNFLKDNNIDALIYHGELEPKEKERMQLKFTNNEVRIIICTNAFGMGIDIPNIRYVIEYDMPHTIDDFVQQVGRASRDGKYAEGIVLFNMRDIELGRYFIERIENDKTEAELRVIKEDRYDKLDKIIRFCFSNKCLHKYISNYFNQKHNGNCKMCSNCKIDFTNM